MMMQSALFTALIQFLNFIPNGSHWVCKFTRFCVSGLQFFANATVLNTNGFDEIFYNINNFVPQLNIIREKNIIQL